MYYHKISKDNIANGLGIRTVLWVSGCSHHCKGCHNPQTWDANSGKIFDNQARATLFENLAKPYVHGITFSGGDPLFHNNLHDIYNLINEIRKKYPNKTIWLYTGYTLSDCDFHYINSMMLNGDEDVWWYNIIQSCDVIVDGEYVEELRDITLPFRGSSNQRIIDVKRSLQESKIVEHKV